MTCVRSSPGPDRDVLGFEALTTDGEARLAASMLAMTTFWTTSELLALGKSPRDIAEAAASDVIEPVRRGLWVTPGAAVEVLRAARVGGVATATTASRALGLWTPPDPVPGGAAAPMGRGSRRAALALDRLHVAVPRSRSRLRDPDDPHRPLVARADVVIHYVEASVLNGSARTRTIALLPMLAHVFATQPPERALAVVDSALRLRHLTMSDLPALAPLLPRHHRAVLRSADARADSGIETIVRFLLRARGLVVEPLVDLVRVGEIDLLVEGRLIVECDGREFHDDDQAFERDRGRDLSATRARYRVLRVTWHQVLFRWNDVEAAVFAALAV